MKRMTWLALLMPLLVVVALPAAEEAAVELISDEVLPNFRKVREKQDDWHNWNTVGRVKGSAEKAEIEASGEGSILINVNGRKRRSGYLMTKEDYQDVHVHLEFMVPKGSNSGVYMMGRYEIQILDSYGVEEPSFSDLGGLYQRWDPKRGKRKEGFEGVAPRVNAAKAPGEWQSMTITFRAPRFNDAGEKTENARFVKVLVNGEVVHENQEAAGPTRAHPLPDEAAEGPIAIQGDHGPIAIRSFKVERLDLN